jgi:hypothetical protein
MIMKPVNLKPWQWALLVLAALFLAFGRTALWFWTQ